MRLIDADDFIAAYCKSCGSGCDLGEIRCATVDDLMNAPTIDAVPVVRWIPVTEQEEPTENGTYLCHGYWFGSRRKQTETADFFGEWNIANNFILTHWMPLPEPPKEEE